MPLRFCSISSGADLGAFRHDFDCFLAVRLDEVQRLAPRVDDFLYVRERFDRFRSKNQEIRYEARRVGG